MEQFKKLKGPLQAVCLVALVLALTGALALLAAEKAERGFLGVSVQGLDDDEREEIGTPHGVRVISVEKGSGAAKAGILKYDVIQLVNGEKIRDPQTLRAILRELAPGGSVKIGLWRGGKAQEVNAVLGKYEGPKRFTWHGVGLPKVIRSRAFLGVNLLEPDADLASYFSVKAGEGVLITGVEKGTPAEKAGLKGGDVIVQMADKPVKASGDIHEALAALKKGDSVAITVVRRGKRETLKAEPDYDRRSRIVRFFSGDKDMEIDHLELPELDIDIPEIDVAPPCPPEAPAAPVMRRVHERLDKAMKRIDEQLLRIDEDTWI
jgi:serine protease Do